jgi:hypothetical protein
MATVLRRMSKVYSRLWHWQHNLVNFKEGYKDKTEEMLAEAL